MRTSPRRETVPEKAAHLLSSGSVRVVEVDGSGYGRAHVAGDHDGYFVTINEHGRRCTCPAWMPCSHALAVELVGAGPGGLVNARGAAKHTPLVSVSQLVNVELVDDVAEQAVDHEAGAAMAPAPSPCSRTS